MARTVNPETHAARRKAILAAARHCFAHSGFQGTSTADICAAAGTSSGNLFHYFPGKQAIIAAVVAEEGEAATRHLEGLMQEADLHAALHGFLDLILTLSADRGFTRLALEIAAEAGRDREIGALAARNDAALRFGLAALAAEAIRRGQIAPGIAPDGVAQGIAALIDGVFSRGAVDPTFRAGDHRATFLLMLDRFLRPVAQG